MARSSCCTVEIRGREYPANIRLGDLEVACTLADSAVPVLGQVERGEAVTVFGGGHQPICCRVLEADPARNYLHVEWAT